MCCNDFLYWNGSIWCSFGGVIVTFCNGMEPFGVVIMNFCNEMDLELFSGVILIFCNEMTLELLLILKQTKYTFHIQRSTILNKQNIHFSFKDPQS